MTLVSAPFFVLIYQLITQGYTPSYKIVIVNEDQSITDSGKTINYGELLTKEIISMKDTLQQINFVFSFSGDRAQATQWLRERKVNLVVFLPDHFSAGVDSLARGMPGKIRYGFSGDLTDFRYLLSAIWTDELMKQYLYPAIGQEPPFEFREIPIGSSGQRSDFDIAVPGLMIFSIVMLMFPASIAMVNEVEKKTILRLKLSKLTTGEFLGGISMVQVMVGIISVAMTLGVAMALGFHTQGAWGAVFLVAVLTSISIISFSLILAAICKSVAEILIIGNFPLFLFMFFTGSMFPLQISPLFSMAGYGIGINGIMSATHSVSALNKILIMDMGIGDIWPELLCLCMLTVLYTLIGWWAYRKRHMKVQ